MCVCVCVCVSVSDRVCVCVCVGWLGVQVQNVTDFVVVELIHLSGVGNLGHLTWVKC